MSSAAAGIGSIIDDDRILVGSGSGISSDSCMVGCGSIKVISWKECDTISKKIGFVVGQSLNFMFEVMTSGYRLLLKTIRILRIDKVFEVFCKVIKGISKKLYNLTVSIFKTFIKPIFINKLTKKIVDITKKICTSINDIIIKAFFTQKPGDPVLCSSVSSSRVKQDSKISKIFKKFLTFIKTIFSSINKWTLLPLYNHILSPVFSSISDVFVGIVGGISQKEKKPEEERETQES
ncbi:MAG: hypothetical protein K940chlam5_00427 [Candidatus Anoxychlamydiales bacterium]|nr:hypothetical protein [Candidatus Anoxychlamydiales bacterium]